MAFKGMFSPHPQVSERGLSLVSETEVAKPFGRFQPEWNTKETKPSGFMTTSYQLRGYHTCNLLLAAFAIKVFGDKYDRSSEITVAIAISKYFYSWSEYLKVFC